MISVEDLLKRPSNLTLMSLITLLTGMKLDVLKVSTFNVRTMWIKLAGSNQNKS